MRNWLLRTIGVGDDLLVHLDRAHLAFQRPAWLWAGLALLVPIAWYILRRQRMNLGGLSTGLRLALGSTRILILGLLVAVLAGPYLVIDQTVEKRPVVAIVFDESRSMRLPAGPFEVAEADKMARAAGYRSDADGITETAAAEARESLNRTSRSKLARDILLAQSKTLIGPMAEKYEVRYYTFAQSLIPLGLDPAHPDFPQPKDAGGSSTRVGDALDHVLDDAAGREIAGILLFSDGWNTGGRSPLEAARAAAGVGAPIFAVPVGSSARMKDIAIVDVFTSGLVSVGDTARIAVTIESQGFEGRTVKIELKDGDKLLDARDFTPRDAEQQQIELTFEAKEAGAKYLTVNIPHQAEESEDLRSNNTDIAFVRVSDETLKVLHIEGVPRWDFRFLKNAMRRDHGLGGRADKSQPDLVLEAEWKTWPESRRKAALPGTLDELAAYHTIILGDVSPQLLGSPFIDLLVKAVRERGVGLLVAAGPRDMPHSFDDRLQELLPMKMRRGKAGLDAPITRPFRVELSAEGSAHEATRFHDDPGRNQDAWVRMPPYYWCAAVERAAPGATVLAWSPSVEGRYGKLPLIAHHYAGQGKVMLVGTDSTWLWRQNVGDRFFYKFWGQSLRFVARQDKAGAKKSRLEVHPIRVQPGEPAEIELMTAAAPDGAPRAERSLPLKVAGAGTSIDVELMADPSIRGRYVGKFVPQSIGEHRAAFEPGGGAERVEARFRVMDSVVELRHPNVNRPELELLASASGGRLVEIDNLAEIPKGLKGVPKLIALHREATLWDNWLVCVALIIIYSTDVGIRRLAGIS